MPEKILVVEDDIHSGEYIRQSLAELFQNSIKIASNADQALTHLQKEPPHLVILDIQLPGEHSGIWLAEQIEAMDAAIPYIFISAHVDYYKDQIPPLLNPVGFISKPFSVAEIQLQVQLALRWVQKSGDGASYIKQKNSFDFTNPCLFTLDESGCITHLNNEAKQALSKNTAYYIGRSIYSMLEPDDESKSLEALITEQIAHGGDDVSGTGEFKIAPHKRKKVKFSISLAYKSSQQVKQMTLIVWPVIPPSFDNQSSRILLEAVEQNFNPVMITTAQLEPPGPQIIYVNDAFCRMTGYNREEIIGRTPRMFQGPKTDRKVLNNLKETISRGKPFEGQTINYKKDGSEYHLRWNITPIKNSNGEIIFYNSIQRDITDQVNRERYQNDLIESEFRLSRLSSLSELDFNAFIQKLVKEASKALRVDRFSFWKYSAEKDFIECSSLYDTINNAFESGEKLYRRNYPQYFEAIKSNRTIAADNALEDPRTCEFGDSYLKTHQIKSMLDASVQGDEDQFGTICAEHYSNYRNWSYHENKYVASLSDLISVAYTNHKKQLAEQKLRKSEARYRSMASNLPGYIVRYLSHPDGSTDSLYISPGVKEIYELPEDRSAIDIEMLWQFAHPKDLESLKYSLQKHEQNLDTWEHEYRIITNTGITKHLKGIGKPEKQSDGSVIWDIFTTDITERVLQESRISELGRIIKNSHNEIYIYDTKTLKFELVSSGALEKLGYSKEEIGELTPADVAISSDRKEFKRLVYALKNNEQSYIEFEGHNICKDGSTYPILVTISKSAFRQKPVFVAAVQDISELKETEEQLRENQKRLEEAQKWGEIGDWRFNLQTREVTWSDVTYQIYGFNKNDGPPTYEQIMNLKDQESQEAIKAAIDHAINNVETTRVDNNIQTLAGERKYVHTVIHPLTNEDGEVVMLEGTVQNITQRKKSELKLKQQYEFLEGINAQLPGVAYEFCADKHGNYLFEYMSEGFNELAGIKTKDALKNQDIMWDIIHPEDYDRVIEEIEKSRKNLTDFRTEYRFVLEDGSHRWILAQSTPFQQSDGSVKWYGIFTNITPEKKREQNLKAINHALDNAFARMELDLEGHILSINENYLKITGYNTEQELLGKHHNKVIEQPPDNATGQRDWWAIVKNGGIIQGEFKEFTSRGNAFYTQAVYSPVRNMEGQITKIIKIATDITDKVQNRNRLEESERRFRHLANHSPVLIWLTDKKADITYVNDYFLEYTGNEFDKLKDRNWVDQIHPKDRQNITGRLDKKIKNAEDFRVECRLKDKDNNYRWFLITGAARIGGNGEFLGHVGVCVDIQQQKEAIEELQEREQQFRMLAESSDDIISLLAHDGTCLYNSPRAAELFSTEYAMHTDDTLYHNMYPADVPAVRKHHKKVLNGLSVTFEWRKKIGEQEYVWLETKARPISDTFGNPERILCSTRIVDERKQRELSLEESKSKLEELVKERTRELRSSEMLHRNLFESMHQGVIYFDSEGRIINMNSAAENILGKNLYEVMGRSSRVEWVEVFDPDGTKRGPENSLIMKAITEGEVTRDKTIGIKNERADSMKWINISVIPIDDNVESTARVYCTMDDITKVRNTQEKLIEARNEAQQLAKVKEQFLANMSHEIRTPMNGIRGMVHLLEDSNLKGEEREYLKAIKQSSNTLLTVINDILDTSKLERGMLSIEHNPFHINDVLQSVKNTLQFKIEQSPIDFSIDIDEDIPPVVLGDRARLYQILINLVGNALKFTHRGFVNVQVSLRNREEQTCYISFSVADSGVGIEQSKLERIFEIFAQEDSSITKMYGGTGLGLAICKKLVELQDGKITVSSKKNRGSTFNFVIPYEEPSSATKQQIGPAKSAGNKKPLKDHHIMVVDDNKVNIMWTEKLLTKWGAEVTSVTSGLGAFEKLEDQPVDIILMDIQMPGYDGYESTHFIRNNFKKPINSVPILGVSADVMKGQFQKCINAGMDGYIGKPFEPEDLLNEIKKCIATQLDTDYSQPETNQAEILSTATLDEVAGNDLSFKKEITGNILDLVDETCTKITEAIQDKDALRIGKLAHTIKPNCKYLELDAYELAEELNIEAKKKAKPFDEIEDLAKRLVASLKKSKPKIEQLLKHYETKEQSGNS